MRQFAGEWASRRFTTRMNMQKPRAFGTIALVLALIAIMIAAGWYAASAWVWLGGEPMPTTGYVAMALGILFSLVIGCGLMALLFYSSRHGYDEPTRLDDEGE
jgi:fatty acid desaturase